MKPRKNKQVVIHPLMFSVYPVVFLYSSNREVFDFSIVAVPVALNLALALVVWWVIHRLTSDIKRSALYTSLLLFGAYSFGAMQEFLSRFSLEHGFREVSWITITVLTSFVIVGVGAAACFWPKVYTGPATYVVSLVGIILVCMPLAETLFFAYQTSRLRSLLPDRSAFSFVPSSVKATADAPDIYYIILDGYGRQDFLAREYGFDNAEFLDSLRNKGFYVASNSRANYPWTLPSLTSSLNFAYLSEALGNQLAAYTDRRFIREFLQQNRTLQHLRTAGYSTVAFASEYYEADLRDVDRTIAEPWFPDSFQIGALQMTPLPTVLHHLGKPLFYDLHRSRILYTIENLPEIADLPSPKFVFAHIYFAHDPFVFGPNGEKVYREWPYTWRQVPGESREEAMKGYKMQVTYLNRKLDAALERLLEKSDKTPIILIQGDHGPSSRTNLANLAETDIHERYGILNAYLLPGGGEKRLYDSISPVIDSRII